MRLFSIASGEQLQEVRRGADSAIISHLAFNSQSNMLSVCSDKGTIHLFLLDPRASGAVKVRPELVENESYDFIGQLRDQS